MAEPFKSLLPELQKHIHSEDNVIDFGCGLMPLTRKLKCKKIIGIDIWRPYIEQLANELVDRTEIGLWYANICEIIENMHEKSIDISLAIDVVEHFEKEQAVKLIKNMERISKKYVLIFTPVGFRAQEREENSEYQRHRCGFRPSEFKDIGYSIYYRSRGTAKSFLAVKEMRLGRKN